MNSGDRVFQKEGTANTKKRHKNKVYLGTDKEVSQLKQSDFRESDMIGYQRGRKGPDCGESYSSR